MKQWMRTRPIRVFGMLLAVSLVLTACDPQSLLQLLDAKPIAQEAPAADAGDDSGDGAEADGAADAADGDGAAKDDRKRTATRDRGANGDRTAARDRSGDEEATERRSPKRTQTTRKKAAEESSTPARRSGGGGSATLSGVEQKIHELLNQTRRKAGLKPLTASADVSKGARSWSCQMAQSGNFRHADLSSAGVNGENIAWGQQGAAAVHTAWMNSSGHRSNRMNPRWSEYGVGVCEDGDGRPYYTERFR